VVLKTTPPMHEIVFLKLCFALTFVFYSSSLDYLCELYYYWKTFTSIFCVNVLFFVAVVDLSEDTGILVSDLVATMQSLGLISLDADNQRCRIFFCWL